jgi:hypothetical protein
MYYCWANWKRDRDASGVSNMSFSKFLMWKR